jgi:hypothetical protein
MMSNPPGVCKDFFSAADWHRSRANSPPHAALLQET